MIRVLHVEDDADIREITQMALSMSDDFEVFQCACGVEAMEKLKTCRPDVFLFDFLMPGMTGPQLLDQIRRSRTLQDIPAIFMTARAQDVDLEKLRGTGAISVIPKPFDPLTLGDRIRDTVRASIQPLNH